MGQIRHPWASGAGRGCSDGPPFLHSTAEVEIAYQLQAPTDSRRATSSFRFPGRSPNLIDRVEGATAEPRDPSGASGVPSGSANASILIGISGEVTFPKPTD